MTAALPVFVQRGAQGEIIGLVQRALTPDEIGSGQWQPAHPGSPEVAAFARHVVQPERDNPLALTDAELARVTEDLIDVLIDRGLIQFTDLPEAAQSKLLRRRQTRATLSRRLDLLGSDDVI